MDRIVDDGSKINAAMEAERLRRQAVEYVELQDFRANSYIYNHILKPELKVWAKRNSENLSFAVLGKEFGTPDGFIYAVWKKTRLVRNIVLALGAFEIIQFVVIWLYNLLL